MKLLKYTLAGTVLALASTSAMALTVSDTASFTGVTTELAAEALRVDMFDNTLGTLTNVRVTLDAHLISSGTITNNAAGPESFDVFTQTTPFGAGFRGTAVGTTSLGTVDAIANGTLITAQSYVNLAGSGGIAAFDGTGGISDVNQNTVLVNNILDASFIGNAGDLFGYDFATLIATTISGGGGNIIADLSTLASATLFVEYTYDVIPTIPPTTPPPGTPEPASLFLIGAGLLGFSASRKNKKAA